MSMGRERLVVAESLHCMDSSYFVRLLTTKLSRLMICLLITIKFNPPVCSTFAKSLFMEENRNHACTEEEKTLQSLL